MLIREVGLGLITAGCVVLLFVLFELVGTNVLEQRSQARLARNFSSAMAQTARPAPAQPPPAHRPRGGTRGRSPSHVPAGAKATTAPGRHQTVHPSLLVPPPGGVLDRLLIPAIGIERYVVQGVSETDLQMGPGHYPQTPLPGRVGNVGIAGHRTTFGAPFFRLNELERGDLVYLTNTTGTTWVYSVARQWVVSPSDVGVLTPTRDAELTLTTCNPRFEATSRLVVRAVLVRALSRSVSISLASVPTRLSPNGHWPGPSQASAKPARAPVRTAASTNTTSTTGPPPTGLSTTGSRPAAVHVAAPSTAAHSPIVSAEPSPALSGGGGAGAWLEAFGWGGLAVATWVATRLGATRQRRYRKLGVLTGGAIVSLVPLWFCFENAVRLLPANY
jgi:LPXTG-site transpeptidase (sortase) family protein